MAFKSIHFNRRLRLLALTLVACTNGAILPVFCCALSDKLLCCLQLFLKRFPEPSHYSEIAVERRSAQKRQHNRGPSYFGGDMSERCYNLIIVADILLLGAHMMMA